MIAFNHSRNAATRSLRKSRTGGEEAYLRNGDEARRCDVG